jgi:NAD(P)-dependent dehydrogenase (short-subunit alcohol dehydrogenase family)
MLLQDKVAVVTGGLGGIGSVVSTRLIGEGARVVIIDLIRKTEQPSAVPNDSVSFVQSDISAPGGAEDALRRIIEIHSSIDILINAAGIQGPIGLFADAAMDRWESAIAVNLLGTVRCCRAALPYMMEKKRGKIINFAGGGANSSRPNFSAYAVSKTGVVRFTEVLADELKGMNIQVNAVAPGVINTRMITEILDAGKDRAGSDFDQIQSKMKKGFDSPEAVAGLVCFLASGNSDWLSGKIISAVWDPWKEWRDKGKPEEDTGDLYVLRRIDGKTFDKVT